MENKEQKIEEEDYLSLKGKVTVKEIATLCYWLFCIGGLAICAGARIVQEIKKHSTKEKAPIVHQEQRIPDLRPQHIR